MAHRNTYLIVLIGCLLLAACSSDDSRTENDGVSVAFHASFIKEGVTRAPNDINTLDELKTLGSFGVFACYTGLREYLSPGMNPDFMYNEHVTYDTGSSKWTYSPLKYWPNGEGNTDPTMVTGDNPHYVSFFAYAPYSDQSESNAAGYCIPSFSAQSECAAPWLTYRLHTDVSQQVDLLYAQQLNQKKSTITDRVTFPFKHALACVGDKVTIKCSENMKSDLNDVVGSSKIEVVLTALSIDYTLTERARLVLWNGDGDNDANWEIVNSGCTTTTRSVDLTSYLTPNPFIIHTNQGTPTDNVAIIEDHGVFYIPLDLTGNPQTAKIQLTYEIRRYSDPSGSSYEVERERTVAATLGLRTAKPEAFASGKHLYFNVDIDDSVLHVTAAITPWGDGGTTAVTAE